MSRDYDDPDRLRELYHEQNMDQAEMADFFGCSKTTVSVYMQKHGVETTPNGQNPKRDEAWLRARYYDDLLTVEQVAERAGVTAETVSRWMDEFDIERRTQTETQLIKEHGRIPKFADKEWLETKYHEEKLTQDQIAELCGVSDPVINRWMKKHGIEARADAVYRAMAKPGVAHRLEGTNGYERVTLSHEGSTYHVGIHRLCAVAWFGMSYFDERDVHHKDRCRSHNAEENLELLSRSDHLALHGGKL